MRRVTRIGLATAAVVLAFGITYIAFAPNPFARGDSVLAPVADATGSARAAAGETESATDGSTSAPTLGPPRPPAVAGSSAGAAASTDAAPRAAATTPDFTPIDGVNHWQEGRQLFWQRDYAAAATELERATRQRPGRYYPHYLLGLCYQRLGDGQRAEREYVAAREIDGDQPEALVNLARLYLGRDLPRAALDLTTQVTEVAPDYAAGWNVHGRAHLELDKRQAALAAFTEATRLKDDFAYAWNNLGYAHILGAEFDAALAPLERAVNIRDDVAYMQNNLGVVLEQLGLVAEAHAAFSRAAELDPGHTRAVASAIRLAALLPAASVAAASVAAESVPAASVPAASVAAASVAAASVAAASVAAESATPVTETAEAQSTVPDAKHPPVATMVTGSD